MGWILAQVLILQLLVPGLLIAWLARPPRTSRWHWLFRCLVTLMLLGLLHLGMVWLIIPVTLSWVWLSLAVVMAVVRAPAAKRLPWRPDGMSAGHIALAAVLPALLLAGLVYLVSGSLPPTSSVNLAFPLGEGRYYVANGGANAVLNPHYKTLAAVPRYARWRGQSYGVDIAGTGPLGMTVRGFFVEDPAQYRIFGRPVYAPCSGGVVDVVDGLPDMQVPQMDRKNLPGNHVIVQCDDIHVVLAHLQRGSVRVMPGQTVRAGATMLGRVGNSGNSSQPHLHIHAQTPGSEQAPLSGQPLHLTLDGWFPVRNDRVRVR